MPVPLPSDEPALSPLRTRLVSFRRRLKRWRIRLARRFSARSLKQHEALAQKIGLSLQDSRLWRPERHAFSAGAALGAAASFWVPVAQIPLSLLLGAWLRVNLPAAALGTLVNTPLTYAPVYWLAAQVGQALLPSAGLLGSTAVGLLLLGAVAAMLVYGVLWGAWSTLALRWPALLQGTAQNAGSALKTQER